MSSTEQLIGAAVARGHLGRFRNLQVLGQGGFGFVLRAEDTWLRRTVALKVPREQIRPWELFLHEARILASLNHPHILTIYSAESEACTQDRELRFFVTEYMRGGDLSRRIAARRFSPHESLVILQQLASGLAAAHAAGILHRDVKAENVLLDSRASDEAGVQTRLADFGLGVVGGKRISGCCGTPAYMAPECWLGMNCPQSDVYALGIVAFLMLTGRFPFLARDVSNLQRCHLTEPLPAIELHCPECPATLAQAISRMLAKDPEKRFCDGGELHQVLSKLGGSSCQASVEESSATIFARPLPVHILGDSVLNAAVDAFAYSANNRVAATGGLAKKIEDAAGEGLRQDIASQLHSYSGELPVGAVIATGGHDLTRRGISKVLHASTLYWNPLTREYSRNSSAEYLRDIRKAVEETCAAAQEDRDIRRLGLTLYGTRINKRLYPELGVDRIIAANVQGLHSFQLNAPTRESRPFSVIISARRSSSHDQDRDVLLRRELNWVRPVLCELADCGAEALIVSANNWLFPGSGNARVVFDRAGVETQAAIMRAQPVDQPLPRGAIVTVHGGQLTDTLGSRQWLIHAVTTSYRQRTKNGVRDRLPSSPRDIYEATRNALLEAVSRNARSVGLTLMCARDGYHALSRSEADLHMARAAVTAANDLRTSLSDKLEQIVFCLPQYEVFQRIAPRISLHFGL